MVTLIEINKAIDIKIKDSLKTTEFKSVPIVAEDVSEPIVRPSLKVEIDNTTDSNFNANCKEKNLVCRVYFFAKDKDKYKLDNTKMRDILSNALLSGIYVKPGFFVPIENVECEVSDTVLICSFDMYSVELWPDQTINDLGEPIELMEELEFEGVIK
jgi:hypothetical protein